jgi:hypothetical protein
VPDVAEQVDELGVDVLAGRLPGERDGGVTRLHAR